MSALSSKVTFYAGSYSEANQSNIYQYTYDPADGSFEQVSIVSGIHNPSFLAIDAARRYVHAVSENVGSDSVVNTYSIDSSGHLVLVQQQSSHGETPCHLSFDKDRNFLLLTNYNGGFGLYPTNDTTGIGPVLDHVTHEGSGPNPDRQEKPHPHSAIFDPSNQYIYVPDLGIDLVVVYRWDAAANKLVRLHDVSLQPGAGPRHMVFHPVLPRAYVINELDSTIAVFHHEVDNGGLSHLQTISTLPDGYTDESTCADIHVSADGRFVYGSNRGHDSIAVYAVDQQDGTLTLVQIQQTNGKTPRNFAISPDGTFLLSANQDSDCIVPFAIDAASGRLTIINTGTAVSKPVVIKFWIE